jgi:hypothetical protein
MATRTDKRGQLEIARRAVSARDDRVPPEPFCVQQKECAYRARDPPASARADRLMPSIVGRAIAEYYMLAKE